MTRRAALVLLAALVVGEAACAPATPPPAASGAGPAIGGFTLAATATQRALETRFRALPEAAAIERWHRYLTGEPHVATSPRTREIAEYIAAQWRTQGLEAVTIRRYDVLSSNPRRVHVEMVAPRRYVPTLREDPYPDDPDSSQPGISGAWTSFSASGDVTAPVVYANSGNPADYDHLRASGIDPRGKIVVVRYSNPYSYRGFKALTAERAGAAAMIVYSDPAEDGFTRGEVFPKGPWGPASHLQRGGIAYDYIVPGDPLTPGWASVEGARRLATAEAVSVPKVMALPMSHRDIQPILEALGGPEAPAAWKGALPITYRLGGVARLRVQIDMQTDVQPNFVVEGRIGGSERPDEWVVLGNHHDAWVFGGVDPSSGTASMLELTKALGQLAREGVRPRRTLVFGSWDGEEVTLTGSTEWGEQFADELKARAVAYLNVDSAASGPALGVSAVGTLAPMIEALTGDLTDPSGRRLIEAWRSTAAESSTLPTGARAAGSLVVTRIGSGSDHTVFINHLGVPVVDMSFNGPYGVYHSAYDSHYWVSRIGDPGFRYAQLMTQLWGTMALRLANAMVLPLDVEAYATALAGFVTQLDEIPDRKARLDTRPLAEAVSALAAAGRTLNTRAGAALAAGRIDAATADAVNQRARAVRAHLAARGRHPGPALVQASAVRAALHLCSDDAAGDHRSGRSRRLDDGARAARSRRREGAGQCRAGGTGDREAALASRQDLGSRFHGHVWCDLARTRLPRSLGTGAGQLATQRRQSDRQALHRPFHRGEAGRQPIGQPGAGRGFERARHCIGGAEREKRHRALERMRGAGDGNGVGVGDGRPERRQLRRRIGEEHADGLVEQGAVVAEGLEQMRRIECGGSDAAPAGCSARSHDWWCVPRRRHGELVVDRRQQRVGPDRLRHEAVHAGSKAPLSVARHRVRRDRDDRRRRVGSAGLAADGGGGFIAVHARHLHVHENHVEAAGLGHAHGLVAGPDRRDRVAVLFQHVGHDGAIGGVVLDDQHVELPSGHRRRHGNWRRRGHRRHRRHRGEQRAEQLGLAQRLGELGHDHADRRVGAAAAAACRPAST